jgi:hypothetical protein
MVNIYTSCFDHQSVTLNFVFMSFMSLGLNGDYLLEQFNQFIFITVKCGVLFAVQIEILNITKASVGFKELIYLISEFL